MMMRLSKECLLTHMNQYTSSCGQWYVDQLRLVPPLLSVGAPTLLAGLILGEIFSPCPGRVCGAWEVWVGLVLGVLGGFLVSLAGALFIAYLIQVRSVKDKLSSGIEVVLRRRVTGTNK